MNNTKTKAYTVKDQETVKNELQLDHSVVGLEVTLIENGSDERGEGTCMVEPVPRGDIQDGLEVSNSLLRQLLEEGAIELKDA